VSDLRGTHIHITGVVQGVGFRPFVYALAKRFSLKGWVRNTSAGVDIEVEGAPETLTAFQEALQKEAPPLARIDEIHVEACPPNGYATFEIVHSEAIAEAFQPISPDVSLCDDCLRELLDAQDRRHRYPFINCTNCGPRFTIIEDIPYDRPKTTMAAFPMCAACAAEYEDPLDRRFHAQPVACPVCGPKIWLETEGERLAVEDDALRAARQMIREGKILAIKGLGGFHLACDATNAQAVAELRQRKLRVDKPFAVMVYEAETAEAHCNLNAEETAILTSRERPIVILHRKADSSIVSDVTPNQNTLGMMLPYTPLHVLLLEPEDDYPEALVMTSGNMSEEPIATENEEARERLASLADAFLMHDRGIRTRCDDAVVRAYQGEVYPLRRARGYAPNAIQLPWDSPPLLATGPELKNTFCLTRGPYAFLSHHIGDLENYETLTAYHDGVTHFERLFRIQPEAIAYDLHPNYMATRYALERAEREGLPAIGVQHHHAHIAACMAEHGLPGDRRVIGVSFDGTGYGADGAIWGGEILLADYIGFERASHLTYTPMPGGDVAIRHPWRLALAWLSHAGIEWGGDLPPVKNAGEEALRVVGRQLELGLNAPLTSSMGRLFDAVAALIGVRGDVNYEAQAAIELEMRVDANEKGTYAFTIGEHEIDPTPVIEAIVADLRQGEAVGRIAARFHRAVAEMVHCVCDDMRERREIQEVVLSGGVWQNMVLLSQTVDVLQDNDFTVYVHRQVPANDGGIALGQAAVALHRLAMQDAR
jgi:hydrogenase maturation protein HypF